MPTRLISTRPSARRAKLLAFSPRAEALEGRELPATLLGLTSANTLLQFDSASPGTIAASLPITGLTAGDTLRAIDNRPSNGQLYGVATFTNGTNNLGRTYTIDLTATTATATPLAGNFFLPTAVAGIGIAFNPVSDRIRLTTSAGDNLQVDPTTGGAFSYDTTLNTDPPSGPRNVPAISYTTPVAGTTPLTLYGYDFASDRIVTIGSVGGAPLGFGSGRVINVGGASGIVVGGQDRLSLDIDTANIAYLSANVAGVDTLYTVDLAAGTTTLVAPVAVPAGQELRGLSVAPTGSVAFSATNYDVNEQAGFTTITVTRTGGLFGPASVAYATSDGTATAGTDYVASSGTLNFLSGEATRSFVIPIFNDAVLETAEQFNITLTASDTNPAALGTNRTATVTIAASDPDSTGPIITDVRVIRTGFGRRSRPTGLAIVFNELLDATRANNILNYSLVEFVRRGRRSVPRAVQLVSAIYDPATLTVNLSIGGRPRFSRGGQLFVNGTNVGTPGITDLAGNLLSGTNTFLLGR